ncbi:hypothetical protein ACTHOQ_15445 [Solibacillus silvestris]|uniref:hypothetical protein n=1 Tax=Solibacillus silvestris TaxID=76853 RepID=UPI003F7E4BA0
MRKYYLLFVILLLAACSNEPNDSKWVAQAIPSENKEEMPILEGKVSIHSTATSTIGYVIEQRDREKWILVNAEHIANHPYSLVQDELLTLGETYAIDVAHNIAVVHIRNSLNYEIETISTFKTVHNGKEIIASQQNIEALLNEAMTEKIDWQKRLQKNKQLLQNREVQRIDNFTTYYGKNTFTYNIDELKAAAMNFVERLNAYIRDQNEKAVTAIISSDDVLHELQYMKKSIDGFQIKEARKEGVYYFVNGVDGEKKDVRLTFINEKGQFKVIGANFLSAELVQQQKIPHIHLTEETTFKSVPALQMFLNAHIPAIKLTAGEIIWQLEREERGIAVKNGSAQFSCVSIAVTDNHLVLNGCTKTKNENYIIATFKK